MNEALSSSETSVLTKATRRNIPEDAVLHSPRCENLKSYIESSRSLPNDVVFSLVGSAGDYATDDQDSIPGKAKLFSLL
jgi:hypothetical protein